MKKTTNSWKSHCFLVIAFNNFVNDCMSLCIRLKHSWKILSQEWSFLLKLQSTFSQSCYIGCISQTFPVCLGMSNTFPGSAIKELLLQITQLRVLLNAQTGSTVHSYSDRQIERQSVCQSDSPSVWVSQKVKCFIICFSCTFLRLGTTKKGIGPTYASKVLYSYIIVSKLFWEMFSCPFYLTFSPWHCCLIYVLILEILDNYWVGCKESQF